MRRSTPRATSSRSGEAAASAGKGLDRTQVGEQVHLLAHPQQAEAAPDLVRDRVGFERPAHRAEQDRIRGQHVGQHLLLQEAASAMIGLGAEIFWRDVAIEAAAGREPLEHAHGLADDLRPDAVARQHDQIGTIAHRAATPENLEPIDPRTLPAVVVLESGNLGASVSVIWISSRPSSSARRFAASILNATWRARWRRDGLALQVDRERLAGGRIGGVAFRLVRQFGDDGCGSTIGSMPVWKQLLKKMSPKLGAITQR